MPGPTSSTDTGERYAEGRHAKSRAWEPAPPDPGIRAGGIRDRAMRAVGALAPVEGVALMKKLPSFEDFCDRRAKECGWFFEDRRAKWQEIIQCREDMTADSKHQLIAALQRLIKEANEHIKKLEQGLALP
jgi:hypothetical protein